MIVLRAYQSAVRPRARELHRSGVRRLLWESPTGSGKTVVAAEFIDAAVKRGTLCGFFAHRRELIEQTWKKLILTGIPTEQLSVMMAGDKRYNPQALVQVCSIDTFRARCFGGNWPDFRVVLVDEAHRSMSATYKRMIDHYVAAGAFVLGMTATPIRTDGKGLGDIYQHLDVIAKPSQLIEEGFLVAPRVFSTGTPDMRGVKKTAGDYNSKQLEDVVMAPSLVGEIVPHWKKLANGVRTICFAAGVAHSQNIVAQFLEAGVPAEHVDGETPKADRDGIFARLRCGETLVVSNVDIATEGWDCPEVRCCIQARPTASLRVDLQQCGRVMRPYNGEPAIILDHAGNCLRHGLPHWDREYTLATTKPKEKGQAPVKVCPQCGAVGPGNATTCEQCGYEWPAKKRQLRHESGTLLEVRERPVEELRESWEALVAEWEHHNSVSAKPRRPGWIYHKFVERYGRKPPPGCKTPADPNVSPEQKEQDWARLQKLGHVRGYHPAWARKVFHGKYGHGPDLMVSASS